VAHAPAGPQVPVGPEDIGRVVDQIGNALELSQLLGD
jgi:hypothetical protein